MKLKMERRAVNDLVPYGNNTKKHGEQDLSAIAASIERFGFNDPIGITPDNVIVEGHGRWMAAQRLGITDVPVLVLEDMSPEEHDLYRIAHNKIAQSSTFDFGALFAALQTLVGEETGIAFADMGFSDGLMANLSTHFAAPEERERIARQALNMDGTPFVYDMVWDTKADKELFTAFMNAECAAGAAKSMGGEVLMAAIAKADPDLFAQLVSMVPGEVPLDQIAGATADAEEEVAHVTA